VKRSHLVDAFLASAWYLHGPIYDRLSNLLHAHLVGAKSSLRLAADIPGLPEAPEATEAEPTDECCADQLLDGVAVIDVRGVLAMHADEVNGECLPRGRSYDAIREQLDAALADPAVQQIVLRLETPGGCAIGCQETFDALRAADAVKPVHAYLTGYCFSAGMYLAAGCRSITAASTMTEVGSIGTICATWDTSAAAEQAGMKRIVIRAGAYKALMQDGEPVTAEAIAEEQRIVDAYGAAFHDAVRSGCGLTEAQAEAVCNGRTWMAGDAVALGLVDQIATFPAFLAGLAGTEPAMFFGKKKPAPAPACAILTPPAAAGTSKESIMDPKLQAALAALSASHPTHAAALVAEATKTGATAESLNSFVTATQVAALSANLAAVTAELASAKVAAQTQAAANAAEIARLKALVKISDQAPADVGGDPPASAKSRKIPTSQMGALSKQDGEDIAAGRAVFVLDGEPKPSAN